jgi:type VII secretion system ESX-1 substrate
MAASLAETSDPEKLIPGHPDAVRITASRFTVFGDALVAAGEGLKRIDTERWLER